jgi:uncharacterized OB-fold protein
MTDDDTVDDHPVDNDSPSQLDGWEPRPVPTVTPETREYWAKAAEGVLAIGRCPDCDLAFFYPRAYCPDCLASTDLVAASGEGTVYSYTVPEQISGWPEAAQPLVVTYVELDEGPRIVSNVVDCSPADVAIGDRVTVTFVPTDDEDVAIPVFEPVE